MMFSAGNMSSQRGIETFSRLLMPAVMLMFGLLAASSACAQDPIEVTLTDETGTVDSGFILIDFKGNGETSIFEGSFTFDISNMTAINLGDCLSGTNAIWWSCTSIMPNIINISLATDFSGQVPLEDFIGSLSFGFDGNLGDGHIIKFEWDKDSFATALPEADVIATDGSITIVDP